MGLAATVLFAEDDAIIRQSVGQSLMLMGYRVLLADDGYEALRLMTQEDVDLLLTDIVMPGLDGVELARKAKTLRPSLQIMFLTGYAYRARDTMHLGKLLHKPLRLAQIESEVRDYLAA
jgi:two-component system, cell cycle response regulator CpdR